MLRFRVEGMSCGHCIRSVTDAVKALDPAAEVHVDLARKEVHVDSREDAARIAAAIRDAGYNAGPLAP